MDIHDIPAYIICLEKTRQKRCDPTFRAWKHVLPNTQRLKAITPQDFNLADVAHPYALSCMQRKQRKTLEFIVSPVEVACGMSHIKAWQRIADTNTASIVVEDDMALPPEQIESLLRQLDGMPSQTDMYLLQFNGINLRSKRLKKGYIDVQQFTGLMAYYLTPVGARKLLKNAFPIVFQIDTYAARCGLRVRSKKENQMSWIKFIADNIRSTLGKNHISSRMMAMLIALVVLVLVIFTCSCTFGLRYAQRRLQQNEA